MIDETQARREIVEAGSKLYSEGFIAAADGNISIRLGPDRILATPSGVSKGFMRPGDLVIVDDNGRLLDGKLPPSSELKMHLLIYSRRPDVNAVVHAHPPIATGFAASGVPLDKPVIAEAIVTLGNIPLAPYGTPGTTEVTDGMKDLVGSHDAMLMANHGAVAFADTLEKAVFRMETIEHFAKVSLVTHMLGKQDVIPQEKVEKLWEIREKLTGKPRNPCDSEKLARVVEVIVLEVLKAAK